MKYIKSLIVITLMAGGLTSGVATKPAMSQSNQFVTCESRNANTIRCGMDTSNGVELIRQLSSTTCNGNWGWGSGAVWVRNGCRAEFGPSGRGNNNNNNNNDWNNGNNNNNNWNRNQNPRIATAMSELELTQSECVNRASDILREKGWNVTTTTNRLSQGERNRYTAQIRCMSNQNLVIFTVAGPDQSQTESLVQELRRNRSAWR